MNEVSRELFPGEAGYVDDHEPDDLDENMNRLLNSGDDFTNAVDDSWSYAEPLFAFVNPDAANAATPQTNYDFGYDPHDPMRARCGCLTMIKSNQWHHAFKAPQIIDEELTAAIKADRRLPDDPANIQPEHLPVFAEWQRFIRRRFAPKDD